MTGPLHRRAFIKAGALAAAGMVAPGILPRLTVQRRFDIVIRGGSVLDGTGAPAVVTDVGVSGDRIEALGSIAAGQGTRVIEARGLVVAPGFIDMHTHSDSRIFACPTADSRIRQGVTTEVTGNCGSSFAPRKLKDGGTLDVAGYVRRIREARIAVNHALLLGQGTIRSGVMGLVDRKPTRAELQRILDVTRQGLEQGAFGLSSGLEYTPGSWTTTGELVEMARVVARFGGFYATHMRDEEDRLLEAIGEALTIGRKSGARVEISHLKAGGRPNWGKMQPALDLIDAARRSGVDVMADAYPYTAYSTGLTIFLDPWARVGGTGRLLARLKDPQQRARMRRSLNPRVKSDPGEFRLIIITSLKNDANQQYLGQDVERIAASMRVEPAEAMLRLLESEKGSVSFIGHGMSEKNVDLVLAHPLVMIGSDGSARKPPEGRPRSLPHPRSYGTCARVLGRYVRERKILDLPTAVKKMTSMPADQAGIRERGRIARGLIADLVVFDASRVIDRATFTDPQRFPEGILHVLVAGTAVLRDGKPTDARPGRMLSARV